jgi:hypothetical protein
VSHGGTSGFSLLGPSGSRFENISQGGTLPTRVTADPSTDRAEKSGAQDHRRPPARRGRSRGIGQPCWIPAFGREDLWGRRLRLTLHHAEMTDLLRSSSPGEDGEQEQAMAKGGGSVTRYCVEARGLTASIAVSNAAEAKARARAVAVLPQQSPWPSSALTTGYGELATG